MLEMEAPLKIIEGTAALDFIRVYNPLSQLKSKDIMPAFSWDRCSFALKTSDIKKLQSTADRIEHLLSSFKVIVVLLPAGLLLQKHLEKPEFIEWLKIFRIHQKNKIGVLQFAIGW
ncbi:MAG TPA: hypothetical protein VE868_11440 [Balneolaceae bacterium]|nr:hypothetical protein [Balneolaceae bacterium]